MDFFVESLGGVHVRGPIVRIETVVSRMRRSQVGEATVVAVPNGDVVMTLDVATKLRDALSEVIVEVNKQLGKADPR